MLKAVAAISVLGLAWVVSRLAAWRGVDEAQAAAFVALNPLVLVHVVGGAHNDGLAMLLAMLGVAALVARREASSGASLVASAAIKSSSLFVAPFAFVEALRESASMAPTRAASADTGVFGPSPVRGCGGALGAAVVFAVAGYIAFGWHWLHAFGLAGENQGRTSHLSIPVTFARLTGIDEGAVRVAALVLFGVAVVWLLVEDLARRRLDPRRRLGGLRPAARHLVAPALVPGLAAAARRRRPRPPPRDRPPRPHRLPARRPHPPLTSGVSSQLVPDTGTKCDSFGR